MFFICANRAVQDRFPSAEAAEIIAAVNRLGTAVDVSGQSPDAIRQRLGDLPPGEVCLVGGYDLMPPFVRPNPSARVVAQEDQDVATDAPYGARPGHPAEEFLPTRAVSRIPDSGTPDGAAFLALLERQARTATTATGAKSFEHVAAEFRGSASLVHRFMAPDGPVPLESPPDDRDTAGLQGLLSGSGRLHFLLHGANFSPKWASLWGHAAASTDYPEALSADMIRQSDLTGAIVSFSSCYAAMLDTDRPADGVRTPDNQVALASLAAGAKVVFGSTRANWIDIDAPFNGFGAALVAHVWRQLAGGFPAAEALRRAKWIYLDEALRTDAWSRPYALKTVLQAQCYGHPAARL